MRNRTIGLAIALLMGFVGSDASHAQGVQNIIPNGGFEDGVLTPWGTYGTATTQVVTDCAGATIPEKPIEGKYCLYVDVAAGAANFWDTGLQPSGEVLQKGKKYTVSAFLKAKKGTLQVNMKTEFGADPWTAYAEQMMTITDEWAEYSTTTSVLTADVAPASFSFHIGTALGGFWVDAVRYYEGDYVPPAFLKNFSARGPSPEDGAMDVPSEVVLGWEAGPFAATHDVYFGDNYDDVNNATVALAGQAELTFDPDGLLEFGKTYYWRVDEVNAPSAPATFKGDVWSFTVEPYAYTITGVTATASSSAASMGPEKTVDGSGLGAEGLHSSEDTTMWLSASGQTMPAWIQFNFDRVYKLDEMRIWNSNQKVESFIGFGAKSTTIEYSVDGQTWTTLSTIEIPRAPGQDGYAGSVVDMAGLDAKFVRLVIAGSWGGFIPQAGLSEVRFTQIPVLAREPKPAGASDGASLEPVLSWRPGREAVSHKVYLSGDLQAVVDGTALVGTVTENNYQASGLEYGKTYYWKIDEVNDAATPAVREGAVWSFSTAEFFAVDDFESYNDDDNRIYDIWIDGFTTKASGSTVGNLQAPFAEQTTVHGGYQAMPMDYDNSAAPYYSEAEQTFDSPQNWTASGADSLVVWYRGQAPGFAQLASGNIVMSALGADIWNTADEFRYAYKTLNGDGAMVARVESIVQSDVWAKGGVMIRQSIEAGSNHATMALTPSGGNGASFQHRLTVGGVSTSNDSTTAVKAPYWVKIERKGNAFSGFMSPDGNTWTQLGTPQTVAMTGPVLIGLAVCSHNPGTATAAEFSNITTTGGVTGSWQITDIGVEHPKGNSIEGLYLSVKDSSGKTKVVQNPDAAATTSMAWQEWRIPLSEFTSAGVKMNAVKSLAIGVGNKAAPKAGGTGRVYIDDVQVGRRGSSDPGLGVAYYGLEDAVTDGSGNGHDGTAMGGPVYIEGPAGIGKALLLDGKGGQYVNTGTWNPSAATGQLSVSLWAKWGGLTTFYQGLIGKRDTWAANQMMWQIEANQTTGTVSFSRTDSYPASGNPVLPIGEWAHVLVTFDGTTAKFFVDGKMTGSGAFSFGSDTEAGMSFGACEGAGGNPFNGALDEVRLYDRALSSFEIAYLAGIE